MGRAARAIQPPVCVTLRHMGFAPNLNRRAELNRSKAASVLQETVDLSRNLRLLCSHYRSVAEVCRRIGINRQQFNKYLGGQTQPSVHNLRRIADFFGIDEAEIFLPHDSFTETVISRPTRSPVPLPIQEHFRSSTTTFKDSRSELERYCGYYHYYLRSPAWPGGILCDLMVIHQDSQMTYSKVIERLRWRDETPKDQFVYKIEGLAVYENNRIFLLERQRQWNAMYALAVLYPSHRSRITRLSGIMESVSSGSGRRPFASRIVLDHLGPRPDVRAALGRCGVYRPDSDEISADIKRTVSNELLQGDMALTAMEI